jgi:hypothetical protein
MKRSSSIAALPHDPEPEYKWNYQDEVLASNMMLVSIDEDTNHSFMQRNQQGSMGSMASSRCSSRGSMTGWGSTVSRKSYKRDLCSLANLDDAQLAALSKEESKEKKASKDIGRPLASKSAAVLPSAQGDADSGDGDSWGFFVDAPF